MIRATILSAQAQAVSSNLDRISVELIKTIARYIVRILNIIFQHLFDDEIFCWVKNISSNGNTSRFVQGSILGPVLYTVFTAMPVRLPIVGFGDDNKFLAYITNHCRVEVLAVVDLNISWSDKMACNCLQRKMQPCSHALLSSTAPVWLPHSWHQDSISGLLCWLWVSANIVRQVNTGYSTFAASKVKKIAGAVCRPFN